MRVASASSRPTKVRRLLIEGAIVIATLGLATALFFHRGEPLTEGATTRAFFTLAARDSRTAECAADLDVDGYRCHYDAQENRSEGSVERVVVPLNARRGLMLLDGFFEQAEVAERVHHDLSKVRRRRHERFRVDCTVRLLRRVDEVKARWRSDRWVQADGVWLASVSSCEVGD